MSYESIGGAFVGIGAMVFFIVLAYGFYHISRAFKQLSDKEEAYDTLELSLLNEVALKKGIDITKEIEKRNMVRSKRRNFRKRIEEEVYTEMFGKDQDGQ